MTFLCWNFFCPKCPTFCTWSSLYLLNNALLFPPPPSGLQFVVFNEVKWKLCWRIKIIIKWHTLHQMLMIVHWDSPWYANWSYGQMIKFNWYQLSFFSFFPFFLLYSFFLSFSFFPRSFGLKYLYSILPLYWTIFFQCAIHNMHHSSLNH